MRRIDRIIILSVVLATCGVVLHVHHVLSGRNIAPPPPQLFISPSPVPPAPSTSSPPPPPPPPPPEEQAAVAIDACYTHENTEYDGDVVIWGPHNIVQDAAACCEKCKAHRAKEGASGGCNIWVYCGARGGCGTQKNGECWGKRVQTSGVAAPRITVRASGDGIPWTSGAVLSPEEAKAMAAAEAAAKRALIERRERKGNPKVYFDVSVKHHADATTEYGGRIEFVLYAHESPRHAENFRAMCTGEKGGGHTFKNMRFYRIIDMFIDQAGQGPGSIWGGSFDDDPGGLKLKHERPGLLSAANGGPDTNSGHFSIVVSPAPHLDGGYTIFGEVVSGWDTMMAINKLDKKHKGTATVTEAGCLANCEPRPEVGAKCKTREEGQRPVQGRMMHPCVD